MNYHQRLRAVLDAGHPTTGAYSGGSNSESDADRINAINLPGDRHVTEAETAIRESGKWTSYRERCEKKEADGSFSNPGMHDLMSAFTARTDAVNYRDAYWGSVIDQCVAEGSMGVSAADQLRAWSDNVRSHAQVEKLAPPTVGDIDKAWSL